MEYVLNESHIEIYLKLKRGNRPDREIAKEMLVSAPTLARFKKRFQIKYEEHSLEEYEDLRAKGYRDYQIAARWNMTTAGIYYWKKSHGVRKELFMV